MTVVSPGAIIGERFLVEREVASGGMGRIVRAVDRETRRRVAVKLVLGGSDATADRFLAEAAVLARVRHPGVVGYVAHGVSTDGDPWLAMEWLDGIPLSERLRSGPLAIEETVALAWKIADALCAVHACDVVHRDVKPENVFLVGGDVREARLIDLGVARLTTAAHKLTRTGVVVGTPLYMAPEQARGEREVDGRADLFSLGALLWECLTGVPAFQADALLAVLAKILLEPVPAVSALRPGVPPWLDRLVASLLEKDAAGRPASAREVVAALERATVPEAAPAEAHARAFVRERRVLCVLLVGGADELAATLPAEGHASIAEHVIGAAAQFGATAHPLLDGSVLVVMGRSGVATDLAARAAKLALSLHRDRPDLPIAVATGRALANHAVPVGEVVERGASLTRRARDGRVRVDATTSALLGDRFEQESENGLDGAVLASERTETDAPRRLLGKETRCVGRERELGALWGIVAEAFDESVARAVVITAPAGTGKSRLARELLDRLASLGPRTCFEARADAVTGGSAFALLGQAIRRAAGIEDGDSLEAAHAKLAARVGDVIASAERDHVVESIAEMAGIPYDDFGRPQLRRLREDPMRMGDAMRSAFLRFLEAECAAPVVLLLDDLHWGDVASLRLVDTALRTLANRPLAVIGLGRPEVLESDPWRDRAPTRITLPPLSSRACERLATDVLGEDVDPAVLDWVVRKSEGNAFYLEELLRAVSESGRVDVLPDSVLGMLDARLDTLSEEAKRVLRAGSVFGEKFTRKSVEALTGNERRTLDAALAELEAREIVEARADGAFVFRHALIADAAYETLTEDDRVLGHRLAAEWLAGTGTPEALVVAEHFVRGAEPKRAVRWYRTAAEHALEGNDFEGTIACANTGAACGAQGTDLGMMLLLAGIARRWRGDNRESLAATSASLDHLVAGSPTWYRALGDVVATCGRLGEDDELRRRAEQARGTPPLCDAQDAQVVCLARCVIPLATRNEPARAAEMLELAKQTASIVPFLSAVAEAQIAEAEAELGDQRGDLVAAMDCLERALAAWQRAGEERDLASCRATLAAGYVELGDLVRASEMATLAIQAATRLGLEPVEGWARSAVASVSLEGSDADAALAEATRAAELFRRHGNTRHEVHALVLRCWAELERNDPEAARADALRCLELDVDVVRVFGHAAIAHASMAVGDLDAAREHVERVERMFAAREAMTPVMRSWAGQFAIEVLLRLGLTDRARMLAQELARRIREDAERITRPAWRESYLATRAHARILAHAAGL